MNLAYYNVACFVRKGTTLALEPVDYCIFICLPFAHFYYT